ncbi:VOC family protein [Jeotgalibacillus sp. R-1-5s-1]|uniref:VOC family protein n=1 Tax=Jeotgalibacillus sp. R-1-5s-1 TaxID=2555897 RepID=UPI00106986AF|nr:VOC family protein [Jeotgalibacillus sp. R-1-5s-1]TFE00779.1 VOC family protein [Jeotgalibacillus sp. R-1-5s-1]
MKLKMLTIFVTDFERAISFYRDLLDWKLLEQDDYHLAFNAFGTEVHCYLAEKNTSPGDYSNEARTVFVFEVNDIDQKMHEMLEKDITFLHTKPNQNSFSKYAAFVDPFGNVHEICEMLKTP